MENPNPPGIAALGAMTDTLDFVKKMWGNMGVPGMVVPTLSIDEINKKISDLKAVESWLTLNMNMLRGTIQALEVQSGTIAALQSMNMAVGVPGAPPTDSAPPFESPFTTAAQGATEPVSAPVKPAFATPAWSGPAAISGASEAKPGMPDFASASANPSAWWNLLQEQFQQAVLHALSEQTAGTAPAAAPEAQASARAKAAAARKRKPS